MQIFDSEGSMRQGCQKLALHVGQPGDGSAQTATGGVVNLEEHNLRFRMEKAREYIDRGKLPKVDWLDTLAEERLGNMPLNFDRPELCLQHSGASWLIIELPIFDHSVVHEEQLYIPEAAGGAASAERHSMAAVFSDKSATDSDPLAPARTHLDTGWVDCWPGAALSAVADPADMGLGPAFNPIENKHHKLARTASRTNAIIARGLKPNKGERERLRAILSSTSDDLQADEKEILWKFRYTLAEDKKATNKFVLSIDWNDEEEATAAAEMLKSWAAQDPEDALKLLSRRFRGHSIVRNHAVRSLSKCPDAELKLYLLQLVQALRYGALPEGSGARHVSSTSVSSVASEGLHRSRR